MQFIVKGVAVFAFPSESQMEVVLAEGVLEAKDEEAALIVAEKYRPDLERYAGEVVTYYESIEIYAEEIGSFMARMEASFRPGGDFERLKHPEGEDEDEDDDI